MEVERIELSSGSRRRRNLHTCPLRSSLTRAQQPKRRRTARRPGRDWFRSAAPTTAAEL